MKTILKNKEKILKNILYVTGAYSVIYTCLQYGISWNDKISDFLRLTFYISILVAIIACVLYRLADQYEKNC